MEFLKAFTNYIQQQNLFQPKEKLLLAVSGGIDSVVLCYLCKNAGYDFTVAHCNFQLRGPESERDEIFVRNLVEKLGVEIVVKKFNTEKYAADNRISIQVAARELRYKWFQELIKNSKGAIKKIVTAHHANDNIETLLMNFFKGSGIAGLHGILPKQKNICRPLLFAKKTDIIAFAEKNKIAYVEDSSNASDKYTRNYLRNQLLPGLQKIFPQVEDNLLHNIGRFGDIENLYNQAIEWHKKKLVLQKENEIHIPINNLIKSLPVQTILYEIIKEFGFTPGQVDEVMNLIKSESGRYVQSSLYRIIKNRNWLIISPKQKQLAQNILIEENETEVFFEGEKLNFQRLENSSTVFKTESNVACLDAAEISFPLLLRKWKPGDYFYPLGMTKKKKLSRFFIDQKLSIIQKEKIWILEMDKKIIWVVGLRLDDRFKITNKTKQVVKISLSGTK